MRILSVFVIAACLFGAVPPALAEDPYEINAMVSLSGPLAFLGKEEAESLAAELSKQIEGEVRFDAGARAPASSPATATARATCRGWRRPASAASNRH